MQETPGGWQADFTGEMTLAGSFVATLSNPYSDYEARKKPRDSTKESTKDFLRSTVILKEPGHVKIENQLQTGDEGKQIDQFQE